MLEISPKNLILACGNFFFQKRKGKLLTLSENEVKMSSTWLIVPNLICLVGFIRSLEGSCNKNCALAKRWREPIRGDGGVAPWLSLESQHFWFLRQISPWERTSFGSLLMFWAEKKRHFRQQHNHILHTTYLWTMLTENNSLKGTLIKVFSNNFRAQTQK